MASALMLARADRSRVWDVIGTVFFILPCLTIHGKTNAGSICACRLFGATGTDARRRRGTVGAKLLRSCIISGRLRTIRSMRIACGTLCRCQLRRTMRCTIVRRESCRRWVCDGKKEPPLHSSSDRGDAAAGQGTTRTRSGKFFGRKNAGAIASAE